MTYLEVEKLRNRFIDMLPTGIPFNRQHALRVGYKVGMTKELQVKSTLEKCTDKIQKLSRNEYIKI